MFSIKLKSHQRLSISKLFTALFVFSAFIYGIVLIWAVLFKYVSPTQLFSQDRYYTRSVNWIPFTMPVECNDILSYFTFRAIIKDIVYNILLFFPFGFILAIASKRMNKRICLLFMAVAVSVFFEAMQYIFALGATDITDVLSNSIGAALGFAFYILTNKISKKPVRLDRIYTSIMFCVACVALILIK